MGSSMLPDGMSVPDRCTLEKNLIEFSNRLSCALFGVIPRSGPTVSRCMHRLVLAFGTYSLQSIEIRYAQLTVPRHHIYFRSHHRAVAGTFYPREMASSEPGLVISNHFPITCCSHVVIPQRKAVWTRQSTHSIALMWSHSQSTWSSVVAKRVYTLQHGRAPATPTLSYTG